MQSKQKPSLDDVCTLIREVVTGYDDIGGELTAFAEREVWCAETPAASSEAVRARQSGFAVEAVLVIDASEYQGENTVRLNGRALAIYRVYPRPDGLTELYAGEKVGVADGKIN